VVNSFLKARCSYARDIMTITKTSSLQAYNEFAMLWHLFPLAMCCSSVSHRGLPKCGLRMYSSGIKTLGYNGPENKKKERPREGRSHVNTGRKPLVSSAKHLLRSTLPLSLRQSLNLAVTKKASQSVIYIPNSAAEDWQEPDYDN